MSLHHILIDIITGLFASYTRCLPVDHFRIFSGLILVCRFYADVCLGACLSLIAIKYF